MKKNRTSSRIGKTLFNFEFDYCVNESEGEVKPIVKRPGYDAFKSVESLQVRQVKNKAGYTANEQSLTGGQAP